MTSTTVQMSVPRCHCLGNSGLARLLFFIIFLGAVTSSTPVSGQVQTEAVGQVAEEAARKAEALETSSAVLAPQTAPIVVDGRFLFNVRGISAYPAEERAQIVADRITAFAADTTVSVDSLELVDKGPFTAIAADDRLLMGIHDLDSQTEGIDRQILAQFAKEKIAGAIRSYRRDREPRLLLVNTAYAAAATGVLVLMTPAYEGDPEEPKLVPEDKWFELPAVTEGTEPLPLPQELDAAARKRRRERPMSRESLLRGERFGSGTAFCGEMRACVAFQ